MMGMKIKMLILSILKEKENVEKKCGLEKWVYIERHHKALWVGNAPTLQHTTAHMSRSHPGLKLPLAKLERY